MEIAGANYYSSTRPGPHIRADKTYNWIMDLYFREKGQYQMFSGPFKKRKIQK